MTSPLVRPLEESWKEALDAVLRARGAPAIADVARLGPKVAELSRAYNAGDPAKLGRAPLEARIAFSFARDVPKGAAAVRELVATGLLALPADRPLRILDLGAGLGAMTWGIARALAAEGAKGSVESLLVDADGEALRAAEAIHRAAPPLGDVRVTLSTRVERVGAGIRAPRADLVVLGQVVSELDLASPSADRVTKHAGLIRDLLERLVTPDGSLVLVEPALRDRTRHLHALRDALVAQRTTVFAPCPHAHACPALAREADWCHDDLEIDLPSWLVPLARAAGLRWQGLTFSYLVLRRDAETMVSRLGRGLRVRLVSELIRTKGKTEVFVCTERGQRVRVRRLDRDARDGEWDGAEKGSFAMLEGEIDPGGRLSRETRIDVWRPRN